MIPTKFQDINIRIFTRDPSKTQAIQKAFRRYLDKIN
jgi:non-canonical (house-cleaning) NTP pyrophosphatase